MSKLKLFVSAYVAMLILSRQVVASPQDQAPEGPQEKTQWSKTVPGDDLSISQPPPLAAPPPPPEPKYYPYQQQLTFRMGFNGVFPADHFENRVIGFQYLFPKFLAPKLEAGADLQNGGNGHIYAGMRWIWWERSYFRPSLKLSGDHLVTSSEGLSTFTHYENYYLRGTATLEYVVWNPYSVRVEVELLAGFQNMLSEFTVGLSRGW